MDMGLGACLHASRMPRVRRWESTCRGGRRKRAAQIVTSTDPLHIPERRSVSGTRRPCRSVTTRLVYTAVITQALHVIHGVLLGTREEKYIHRYRGKEGTRYLQELGSHFGTPDLIHSPIGDEYLLLLMPALDSFSGLNLDGELSPRPDQSPSVTERDRFSEYPLCIGPHVGSVLRTSVSAHQ
jgi:hypothetical protein